MRLKSSNTRNEKKYFDLVRRYFQSIPRIPFLVGVFFWSTLAPKEINLWDGVIVSYAFQSGEYNGIRMQLMDADLESVYYLLRSEFWIAKFLHLSFELVDHFLMGISMTIICVCIHKIVTKRFLVSSSWSNFTICTFLTFPIWHVLASTTQTFYVFLLSLCMWGIDLIFRDSKHVIASGFILIMISFEMSSLLMFAPILAVVYSWTDKSNKTKTRGFLLPSLVGVLGFMYMGISRTLSVPSGQYIGYNKLVNPLSRQGWDAVKLGVSNYSSFFIIPVIGISVICVAATAFRYKHTPAAPLGESTSRAVILLWPLLLAAVAPYVLVSKSTTVDDFDWQGRHAILLSVPLSITTAVTVMFIVSQFSKNWVQKLMIGFAFLVIVLPQGVLLSYGLTVKLERKLIDQELVQVLRTRTIPAGLVEIVGLPNQNPIHRDYESNYIFFRAYGLSNWWTRIASVSDLNFAEPPWKEDPRYQSMYIYHPPERLCRSIVMVEELFKNSKMRQIKILFHIWVNTGIRIKDIKTQCQ